MRLLCCQKAFSFITVVKQLLRAHLAKNNGSMEARGL